MIICHLVNYSDLLVFYRNNEIPRFDLKNSTLTWCSDWYENIISKAEKSRLCKERSQLKLKSSLFHLKGLREAKKIANVLQIFNKNNLNVAYHLWQWDDFEVNQTNLSF